MDRIYDKLELPIVSRMVSDIHLRLLVWELENVLNGKLEGDVVEFGCNVGTSSVYMQKVLNLLGGEGRKLWCYDSFKGIPSITEEDKGYFKSGGMAATKDRFIETFDYCRLPLPEIKEGWFSDFKCEDVPPKICFAFLDCDLYKSTKEALSLICPNIVVGGKLVFHDSHVPGIQKVILELVTDDSRFGVEWMSSKEHMACINRQR